MRMSGAMIGTVGSAVVAAPPADVYALLVDPARMAELARHPVEIVTSEELADGRRATHTRTRLPNDAIVETRSVVVERIPDRRVVVRSEVSPFGLAPTRRGRFGRAVTQIAQTLEAHPDGTLLTVQTEVRIEPAVLRLYFAVVKRGQWQRATDEILERLQSAFSP